MILARHADALYWVGRYLERAEATVRCLDYAANSIIHLRPGEARIEVEQLVYLRFPRLGGADFPSGGLHEVLLMVRRACLAISGILNEGMRRDEGYEFIVIGRMIERSIFTVGLLIASYTDPRGTMDATRMLRLTSSLQAYHRRHGHAPNPEGVVRYLLHATDLPRSVQSCLLRAEECLTGIGAAAGALDRSRRRAGLLRARLELGEIEGAMASGPVPVLSELYAGLAELASEVAAGVVPPLSVSVVRSQYLRPGETHTGLRP